MTETRKVIRPVLHRPVVALALAVAATAAILPGSADAQQRRGGGPGMMGPLANPAFLLWAAVEGRFEVLAEALELTESQRESATGLVATFREENEAALKSYREMMAEMRGRMGGAGGRPGGQRRAGGGMPGGGQLRERMSELLPVLEGFQSDFHALLNEDQVKKLAEMSQGGRPGR